MALGPDPDFGEPLNVSSPGGILTLFLVDNKPTGDDSEYDEPKEAIPKRQRTSQVTNSATRKKQVRGKQGRLAGLMKMPIDIFTEVSGFAKKCKHYLIFPRSRYILCQWILLYSRARTSSSEIYSCIVRRFIYGMASCVMFQSYHLALLVCASLSIWHLYTQKHVR